MGCGGASKQSITAPALEKPLPTDTGVTKAPELLKLQPDLQQDLPLTVQNEVQPASQPVIETPLPPQLIEIVPPLLLPIQMPETNIALMVFHSPKLPAAHSPPLPQPCESPLLSPEVLNKRKEQLRDSLEALPRSKPQYTTSPAGPEVLQEEVLSSARAPLSPSVAQPGKLELSSEASRVLMSPDSLRLEELPSEQRVPVSPPGKPGLLQLASPARSD